MDYTKLSKDELNQIYAERCSGSNQNKSRKKKIEDLERQDLNFKIMKNVEDVLKRK